MWFTGPGKNNAIREFFFFFFFFYLFVVMSKFTYKTKNSILAINCAISFKKKTSWQNYIKSKVSIYEVLSFFVFVSSHYLNVSASHCSNSQLLIL